MPSTLKQVIVRMTPQQKDYLQGLADIRGTTLSNLIMTEVRRAYPELRKFGKVRKYEKKVNSASIEAESE